MSAFFITFDFHLEGTLLKLEIATTISFSLDFFLTFFRLYQDKDGKWVRSHIKIANRYFFSGVLLVDVISTFPFYLFENVGSANTKIMRMFRLTRIIRIFNEERFIKMGDALISP